MDIISSSLRIYDSFMFYFAFFFVLRECIESKQTHFGKPVAGFYPFSLLPVCLHQ